MLLRLCRNQRTTVAGPGTAGSAATFVSGHLRVHQGSRSPYEMPLSFAGRVEVSRIEERRYLDSSTPRPLADATISPLCPLAASTSLG